MHILTLFRLSLCYAPASICLDLIIIPPYLLTREAWPLDGMKFDSLKERRAKRNPEDLIIDYGDYLFMIIRLVFLCMNVLKIMYTLFFCSDEQFPSEEDEEALAGDKDGLVPNDSLATDDSLVPYASDTQELSLFHESGAEEEEEPIRADLGGGWGRIVFSPIRRGNQVQMDVCRSTKRDASEGAFERVVVTQSKNPALHLQARKSLWGDLWPF